MEIPIPGCIHGGLAVAMARRMVQTDWAYWTTEELPASELHGASIDFLLRAQRRMGIKRTHVDHKVCASCDTEGGLLLKCSTCLVTYYCNADCQKTHWKQHKVSCRPPLPAVSSQYAIALPDYAVSHKYVEACVVNERLHQMLIIVSREYFEETFGSEATLQTFVRMAHTGRPHPYLVNVTFDARRHGSSASSLV